MGARATGKRARNWCARAVGAEWEVIGEAARMSASCAGGMLRLTRHSNTTPEQFIRAYRRALASVLTLQEARDLGLRLTLRLRYPTAPSKDTDAGEVGRYDYDRAELRAAGRVPTGEVHYGTPTEVFAFDLANPADVALWLMHTRSPAWYSADVDGPTDGFRLDAIRQACTCNHGPEEELTRTVNLKHAGTQTLGHDHDRREADEEDAEDLRLIAVADRGSIAHISAYASDREAVEALADDLAEHHGYTGPRDLAAMCNWADNHVCVGIGFKTQPRPSAAQDRHAAHLEATRPDDARDA